ncbi:MAG: DUF2304 domain-containing protein [Ruminococcus sp.]|jgi:hypothetical protein
MNIRTQILVAAVALISMAVLIYMIRGNRLKLKYALTWFLLAAGILVFGCFPALSSALAGFFGIGTPVNMLFFAGFCFSLIIIFSLTVAVSRLSGSMKKLAQETALLKKELEEVKKKTYEETSE